MPRFNSTSVTSELRMPAVIRVSSNGETMLSSPDCIISPWNLKTACETADEMPVENVAISRGSFRFSLIASDCGETKLMKSCELSLMNLMHTLIVGSTRVWSERESLF